MIATSTDASCPAVKKAWERDTAWPPPWYSRGRLEGVHSRCLIVEAFPMRKLLQRSLERKWKQGGLPVWTTLVLVLRVGGKLQP